MEALELDALSGPMESKMRTWCYLLIGITGFFVCKSVFPSEDSHTQDKTDIVQSAYPKGMKGGVSENKNGHFDETPQKTSAIDDNGSHSGPPPQYVKCDINESRIKKDLSGKTLGDLTFGNETIGRIKIVSSRKRYENAELLVSLKAVNHVRRRPGWIGKQGECKLVYGHDDGHWCLNHLEIISLRNLTFREVEHIRKTDGLPFFIAVDEGDLDAVKSFLKKGVNYYHRCRKGETALMIAAGRGHVGVAKILLDKGLPVDATTPDGRTALMIAVGAGQIEMANCLLNHGADPNFKGPLGYPALMLALEKKPGLSEVTEKDSLAILEALLKRGADVNISDDRGITPLWLAITNQNQMAVRLLSAKGADIDKRAGPKGYTPLMEAVKMGNYSLVELLLTRGANVNAEVNGVTPMHLARNCQMRWEKKIELIHILKKAGAEK